MDVKIIHKNQWNHGRVTVIYKSTLKKKYYKQLIKKLINNTKKIKKNINN